MPKNGKNRCIDLSTRLAEVLKQHLVNQELGSVGEGSAKTGMSVLVPRLALAELGVARLCEGTNGT